MPAIPGNVTIMLQRKLYYAHIMLNYLMAFYLWPKGWAKPLVVNWQIIWLHALPCSYKSFNKWKFATMYHAVLGQCNYFGYLKGANEMNRQYFQQAVLLCLLKVLYYVGICSYASCIILCPKLCWHSSPRPTPLWTHNQDCLEMYYASFCQTNAVTGQDCEQHTLCGDCIAAPNCVWCNVSIPFFYEYLVNSLQFESR